jgi:Mg2+ and Co2+ transporter CorA
MKLFESAQDTPEEWPVIHNKPSDQQWISKTHIDHQYIVSSANELQKESEKLQAMIKQQVDGKNNSRTTLFAVIAAVYLPLNLATGVFGMNIKQLVKTPPRWQDVVYLGLPLIAVSVAVPLGAGWIYRQVQTYAGAKPKVFRWWLYWGPPLAVALVVICIVLVVEVTKPR